MIPTWFTKLPTNLIYAKAQAFDVDPKLIAAICYHESRGSVYAVRYEPKYQWLYKAEFFAKKFGLSLETEENQQRHSYGLMQIMGATARYIGFDGSLPALYKPENNLYWGTKYISIIKSKYPDLSDIISAYNAGKPKKNDIGIYLNLSYVESVLNLYNQLKFDE